jgi:putative transposase
MFMGRTKRNMTREVTESNTPTDPCVIISNEFVPVAYNIHPLLQKHNLRCIVLHRPAVTGDNDELAFLTSDLEKTAADITDLYTQHWQIELFFKWIKQNLKIKNFYSSSENTVKLQILRVMISYALMRLVHQSLTPEKPPITVSVRLKSALLYRMPSMNTPNSPIDSRQPEMPGN